MNEDKLYKELSDERKAGQDNGTIPLWYSTAGYQLFKEKYLYEADTVREQYQRIANTAAKYLKHIGKEEEAKIKFMELLWNGWLSPSTPVLANTGTNRGQSVSCSGGAIFDSINDQHLDVGFYSHYKEVAVLTKNGFGTSGYMGDIRPRGSKIGVGGKASGVLDVFTSAVDVVRKVAQGTARRGAWAGYLPIDHGDFDEMCDYIKDEPDDANIGWNIYKKFINRLNTGDADAIRRWKKMAMTKMVTGKGYLWKPDTVNEQNPPMYKDRGLEVKASNLCAEIALFAGVHEDEMYTFTCVLSSLNLAKYDEWKDTDAVFWSTVFLDCIAEDFIHRAKHIKGMEAAVRFTEKSRALGLGACGFHTYLQEHGIPYESFEAMMWNRMVFSDIKAKAVQASEWMAKELGEPEWCKGYGRRNTHLLAIAPTKSTALIMGGISEGINPDPAMIFTQTTAGGEVERVNPTLLKIMKERNVFTKKKIQEVIDAHGSVQGVGWLSDDEKKVFKTAFEINQEATLRLVSQRQPHVCQSQSMNLFFSAEEDERWISHILRMAILDKFIKSVYYIYTLTGVNASKECEACS